MGDFFNPGYSPIQVLGEKNDPTKGSFLVGYRGDTTQSALDSRVKYKATLAEVVADVSLFVGALVQIGDRGNATFSAVLAAGVTPNTSNIIQCTGVPSLAIVLRVDRHVDVRHFGVVGAGDETIGLSTAFQYGFDNSLAIELDGTKTYTASGVLLEDNTHDSLVIFAQSGRAKINYTGPAIKTLINSQELLFCWLKNVEIACNELISVVLDLRNVSTQNNGGTVNVENVVVKDAKQTTQVNGAAGIQIFGEFNNVNVIDCKVINVSRTNLVEACYGIGVSDTVGRTVVTGCHVENVSTPGTVDTGKDADGILVFGKEGPMTMALEARVEVHNNIIKDCQGRFIKLQVSNVGAYNNTLGISDGYTTIKDWRGIDVQSNNGDLYSNTFNFGAGVNFGDAAALFVAQNIRNDGRAKTTHIYKNRCSSKSNIETMLSALSDNGESTFIFDDNHFIGAAVSHMVKHDVGTLATTDSMNLHITRNKATEVISNVFDPFDDVDNGAKLYLEIADNENLKMNNVNIYDENKANFSVNEHFRIRNNVGIKQRVNWVFDMDKVLPGNSFYIGSQGIPNLGPGIGSYSHINTDGYVHRNMTNDGITETRRGSVDGVAWNAWVVV